MLIHFRQIFHSQSPTCYWKWRFHPFNELWAELIFKTNGKLLQVIRRITKISSFSNNDYVLEGEWEEQQWWQTKEYAILDRSPQHTNVRWTYRDNVASSHAEPNTQRAVLNTKFVNPEKQRPISIQPSDERTRNVWWSELKPIQAQNQLV